AGMTDEETERTGELLESIAADRSVLVIEHDMEFVRQIARTVSVLHQGPCSARGRSSRSRAIRASSRCTWAASGREPMLSISGIDVAYGQSQVLWGVDLEVRAGELVCLMGRNGVGKTTLLKTTIGLLATRGGRVTFDGADITTWSPDRRARAGIGY